MQHLKDGPLKDVIISSISLCRVVSEIPGASINSGNVVLDLSKFGPSASVVLARVGTELASITQTDGVTATLDFSSAATAASILEVFVKIKLGE